MSSTHPTQRVPKTNNGFSRSSGSFGNDTMWLEDSRPEEVGKNGARNAVFPFKLIIKVTLIFRLIDSPANSVLETHIAMKILSQPKEQFLISVTSCSLYRG
ncbi:hypothetical protein MGYG_03185 [Nannizzia gypsea CBS 118893]|uniref:Uncharacterized protein n=1 Tax=Arthroderma gypseum (strain ATCC MYA-4604 / CBS 118893) TaxID=535722 RepID=E4URB7_ARTGP|nr:hypothetical protein MGYG_03185 [Nannizzia gypsea CBS 118893]EFR00180.1 hypothetical protein MGYG_03185 [Nannizzia gypsea CBS 118893]